MEKKGFIITIDGPGGVGKSTVSRRIAGELGGIYVDTGAMYRALALALSDAGVDLADEDALADFCQNAEIVYRPPEGAIFINNTEYTGRIRSEEAGALASKAAQKGVVRKTLVEYQRSFQYDGVLVMEGRDIGTVVFPGADAKFYLDADPLIRAQRRQAEGQAGKGAGKVAETARLLMKRDSRDMERSDSPLEKAPDAMYIDTTEMDMEAVVSLIMRTIREKGLTPPES